MKQTKVAIRYAKSLLDLAVENGKLDETQADMHLISSTISENRDLDVVLHSPIITSDQKERILTQLFSDKVSDMSMKFVNIINSKGREGLLGQITSVFVIMAKEHKNIYEAEVTSAHPIDDATKSRLKEIVKELKGGEVELGEKIDSEVIGGFVLRIGDKMIDASVISKIRDLKQEFADNPYIPEL